MPVLLWRITGYALERLEEVKIVIKSQRDGDLIDRQVPGDQHLLGLLNTQFCDVGGLGFSGLPLEQLPQVIGVHVHLFGDQLEGAVFRQMKFRKFDHVQKCGI